MEDIDVSIFASKVLMEVMHRRGRGTYENGITGELSFKRSQS